MLSCDEQDVSEALLCEMTRLFNNLIDGKRDTKDGIVAREAAVRAIVHALIGEIKRSEKPHGAPEVQARESGSFGSHHLKLRGSFWLEQVQQLAQHGCPLPGWRVEGWDE